ncbi:MAG: hypothetical protein HYY14_05710 [Candidatus Omnitrophica bacterium]|nr:hypothetical protein [Candidatus Omnitrophota bacterium]
MNMKLCTIVVITGVLALNALLLAQLFSRPVRPEKTFTGDTVRALPGAEPARQTLERERAIDSQPPDVMTARADEPLNLELVATVLDKPDGSLALIRDKGTGYEAEYAAGDRIRDAILDRIGLGKVVLTRASGSQEILEITYPSQDHSLDSPCITSEGGKRIVNKKSVMAKYKNLNSVLKEVELRPALANGRIQGLKIIGLEEKGLAAQAGFKQFDVIKKINNRKITSPREAAALYKTLVQQARSDAAFKVEVNVDRNGSARTFVYNLN